MDCSDRFDRWRATFPEGHRDAPGPRSHKPSSLDSSDKRPAAGARAASGTPSPARSALSALRGRRMQADESRNTAEQFSPKGFERDTIGTRRCSNDDVSRNRHERKDLEPNDLAEPALEAVSFHDRVPVLRNDDANPRITQKGSEKPNLEVFGSSSLPFPQNPVEIRPSCQALPSRVEAMFRRRRTCWAVGR